MQGQYAEFCASIKHMFYYSTTSSELQIRHLQSSEPNSVNMITHL